MQSWAERHAIFDLLGKLANTPAWLGIAGEVNRKRARFKGHRENITGEGGGRVDNLRVIITSIDAVRSSCKIASGLSTIPGNREGC